MFIHISHIHVYMRIIYPCLFHISTLRYSNTIGAFQNRHRSSQFSTLVQLWTEAGKCWLLQVEQTCFTSESMSVREIDWKSSSSTRCTVLPMFCRVSVGDPVKLSSLTHGLGLVQPAKKRHPLGTIVDPSAARRRRRCEGRHQSETNRIFRCFSG